MGILTTRGLRKFLRAIGTSLVGMMMVWVLIYSRAAVASCRNDVRTWDPSTGLGVVERLQEKQINPADLRIVSRAQGGGGVFVFYQGKQVGQALLELPERGVHAGKIFAKSVRLAYSLEGRGIGTLMYLALARQAQQNGFILESHYDRNESGTQMWERLTARGLAKQVDHLFFEFRREVLWDPEFQKQVDQLLRQFTAQPGESFRGQESSGRG